MKEGQKADGHGGKIREFRGLPDPSIDGCPVVVLPHFLALPATVRGH